MKLFILVLLLHFIADFNLQIGAKLHDMKQKSWWKEQLKSVSAYEARNYRHDWICALFIHSFVWSVVTFLPLIFRVNTAGAVACVVVNTIVHAYIDNAKANGRVLNLIEDQVGHLIQIIVTVCAMY